MRVTLLLLIFCGVSLSLSAQDRCKPDVKYTVKQQSPDKFTIALQSSARIQQVELYDLVGDKMVAVKQAPSIARENDIFTNIKPSQYTIFIQVEGCKKRTIGGIDGIKVGRIE